MIRLAWALAAALITPPATAQTMTLERCAAVVEQVQAVSQVLIETPDFVIDQGACLARDLYILEANTRVLIRALRFAFDGDLDLSQPQYLNRVTLEIEGLRFAARVPSMPEMDYALLAQAQAGEGIDAVFAGGFDAGQLTVDRFALDFPGDNAIEASLTITGLSDDPSLALQGRLAEIDLSVETNGLFEDYALLVLATRFLRGSSDPEADVAALKDQARAMLASLPLPEDSQTALSDLIEDLPNPTGLIGIRLAPEGGVALADLAVPFGPAEGFLADLDITYEPRE